ncbi:wall-associated receptor kinase-like 14 [Herrania umbratica]|uniref:Wall-associated receptor kinase-like 14 n=1 Tax=Herrania umbratica TaxID=108875 RepID=A0A6J1AAE7_9ROSI|nr:wall-associated receptor kinase-like 14 [Herrania umbratica]
MKEPVVLFLAIFLLSLITAQASKCNRSCGGQTVPYPFGFSAGCQIPLNCSSSSQKLVAGFPILTINADRIKISIEATCNRPLRALHRLYGPNYAPTSRNAILLQNCSSPAPCMIPSTMVYTHFEALACSPNSSNISCYSENNANGFADYNKVTRTNCKSFLSSISAESFNESAVLEVRVVELGWWLQGRCSDFCSENAICDEIVSPFSGKPGFRCKCKHGFTGDGYRAGDGCRKAPSDCNLAGYISGKCGGTTRVAVLVGGNDQLTSNILL